MRKDAQRFDMEAGNLLAKPARRRKFKRLTDKRRRAEARQILRSGSF